MAIVLFVLPAAVGAVLAARGLGNAPSRPRAGASPVGAQRSLSDRLRELDEAYRS